MTIQEMQKLKKEYGYSYEQISEASGVPFGTVQKILSGTTRSPRKSSLEKLSSFFTSLGSGPRRPAGRTEYSSSGTADGRILHESPAIYGNLAKSDVESMESSSVPSSSDPAEVLRLDRQGTYTTADYNTLPDDRRFELIDGILYEMSAPGPLHQKILGEIFLQISACIRRHASNCEILFAPLDVQLDQNDRTVVQPDILVFCSGNGVLKDRFFGAPDLIIEILSPSNRTHDTVLKRHKYQAAGVSEYWIIDPEQRIVLVHLFKDSGRIDTYPFRGIISVAISEGRCQIDFDEISRAVARYYPE